jgi:hypothetical protein
MGGLVSEWNHSRTCVLRTDVRQNRTAQQAARVSDLVASSNFFVRSVQTVIVFQGWNAGGSTVSVAARFSGVEARRSTRIERTVPMIIVSQTQLGLSFEERTAAVSLNMHGCRYASRHDYSVGSWIGLQILEPNGENSSPVMRAQVRSIHPPRSPRELYQVGVELEAPANVWGIPTPPEDWQGLTGATGSEKQAATGATPAPEPSAVPAQIEAPASPEYSSTGVATLPAPPPALNRTEPGQPKAERVVITSDQLVAAVHGKLQHAAEKAVHTAVKTRLLDAVRQALGKIDEACRASVGQMEEYSGQRLEAMMQAAREQVLDQMDARLAENRSRWEAEHEAYRSRAEEISQRLENLAADAQKSLIEAQKFFQRIGPEVEPQIRSRLGEAVSRATEEFESAATRVSDRQLVRLVEDKQMVTREAAAQLEASGAEAREQLQKAANRAIEEFKRQMQVQIDLSISDATQSAMSSLASLDAENRASCEARRRAIETEVAQATEQSAEQFRSGIRAFLYSCLVAAVGAIDERAQTTLVGFKDPGKSLRQIAAAAGLPDMSKIPTSTDGNSHTHES